MAIESISSTPDRTLTQNDQVTQKMPPAIPSPEERDNSGKIDLSSSFSNMLDNQVELNRLYTQLTASAPTKDQQAFMALHGLDIGEFDAIKRSCKIENSDDFATITSKVTASQEGTPEVKKANESILVFQDYLKSQELLTGYHAAQNSGSFEQFNGEINRLLERPFMTTLSLISQEDTPSVSRYLEILTKYDIADPLNVPRNVLDKMSILEETAFVSMTEGIKAVSQANMSFEEIQEYINLRGSFAKELSTFLTSFIEQDEKLCKMHGRYRKAEEILLQDDRAGLQMLPPLLQRSQVLIDDYQNAILELKNSLSSGCPGTEELAERIEGLKESIVTEIEKGLIDSYIDTPSDIEKTALKNLLKAAAELGINDDRIILYSRLATSALSDTQRTTLFRLYQMHKDGISPAKGTRATGPMYGIQTTNDLILSYPETARDILRDYDNAGRKDIDDACNVVLSAIGTGQMKSDILFYGLQSAGFSEKELLSLTALAAYDKLSAQTKDKLSNTYGDTKLIYLKEIEALADLTRSEEFKGLDTSEKERIYKDFVCLKAIYSCEVGSVLLGNYDIKTATDKTLGRLIASQLESAEYTPELSDDKKAHDIIIHSFRSGMENIGLSAIEVINTHIMARKVLGEPINQDFVSGVLDSSNFSGTLISGKLFGIDSFKSQLMDCFSYMCLEYDLEKKPHFNKSREETIEWVKDFIADEIRAKIEDNPSFAGSEELSLKMGLLGNIDSLLRDTGIMTDNELQKLYFDNPIVPVSEGLTVKDLEKSVVSRTLGFENIPEEVREWIMKDPKSLAFCRENPDLLNIYWVPREESNESFGGYATYDKNTIFVVYQTADGKPKPDSIIASTILHELQHKVDMREINGYMEKHPDFSLAKTPTLITERNARLRQLEYMDSIDFGIMPDEERIIADLDRHQRQDELDTSEFLLNNPAIKGQYIGPPFAGVDTSSYAMDIYPPCISKDDISKWDSMLSDMGYDKAEKQWLMERIIGIYDKLPVDVSIVPPDKRDLFVDFLGRHLIDDKAETNGFYNGDFYIALLQAKENIGANLSNTIKQMSEELKTPGNSEQKINELHQQMNYLAMLLEEIKTAPTTTITRGFAGLLIDNATRDR